MKKIISLLLAIIFIFSLTACGTEKSTFDTAKETMTKYLKEKYDIDVELKNMCFVNKFNVETNEMTDEASPMVLAQFVVGDREYDCMMDTTSVSTKNCYDNYQRDDITKAMDYYLNEKFPNNQSTHWLYMYNDNFTTDYPNNIFLIHRKFDNDIEKFFSTQDDEKIVFDISSYFCGAKDIKNIPDKTKEILSSFNNVVLINFSNTEIVDGEKELTINDISANLNTIADYNILATQKGGSIGYKTGNGTPVEWIDQLALLDKEENENKIGFTDNDQEQTTSENTDNQ